MSEEVIARPNALLRHIGLVSGFQIKTLVFALITAVCGTIGMGYHWANESDQTQQVQTSADGKSFVRSSSVGKSSDSSSDESTTDESPWSQWISQKGFRIGLSFIGGFIIGFIFRTFVKTMALLTLCIVGVLGALSYFHIINIDFSKAQDTWNSNSEWITTQATKLKDLLWQYLPSSTTGTAGAFIGARRKVV